MPQYIGVFRDRIPIADLPNPASGRVGGVLSFQQERLTLYDNSGTLTLKTKALCPLPQTPCWAVIDMDGDKPTLVYHQAVNPNDEFRDLAKRRELLLQRHQIHQTIRSWFLESGFMEADTPVRVANPGMEPYLDGVAADGLWLRTSPELHMKRLLAAGFDKIFQMGPCFRAGDRGSIHREEFHMLEWYRAFADLNHLVEDINGLLRKLAALATQPQWFQAGVRTVTCEALFQEYLDIRLTQAIEPLRELCLAKGLSYEQEDDWDTLYFLLFLNFIEPHLGHDQPLIVTDYPASQAALAKKAHRQPDRFPTCHRFELYMRGVEIANAFYELTDPVEQRKRFEADNRTRAQLGKPTYPMDESFLGALESGIPPSAGIALGVDRLTLACLERDGLDEILPFKA